ncbi:MAG: 3-deoxy-D-manno-octulosonic acid transferase [Bacteroidales bacterium]|nr:3-deoxy-D-manno-octulosonic acid transferase [Bacteroidales bacterium]MCF8350279.1 3-deoxy-D-manno-octulosonic acid transferase [Bacteroidales bacterium]MCF8376011.1 3-deoxy-D-manno-octulosonic acid transferase [Bacteroidales bacterium]MCF8402151.1 3-deoxy-D-manno-octulosonic acid transferase [Bacteroidales bacterium]
MANSKARQWVKGRKGIFMQMGSEIQADDQIIWMHCASLGEFEQGRPVIEALKQRYPAYKIMLTFFSPSGYEIRKNYENADYVYYLPADTPANVKKFIGIARPKIAIFVKYEYWYHYIRTLSCKGVPVFMVSAVFRKNQHFFKWYGKWFLNQLKKIEWFFLQQARDKELLADYGIRNTSVSGDTRFDRVWNIREEQKGIPLVEKFVQHKKVFLAGSSWLPDEKIVRAFMAKEPKDFKYIIAPHQVHGDHIKEIVNLFGVEKVARFSAMDDKKVNAVKVLVIDSIGILSMLYRYANYALIGGGFGVGIHNILEASAFGVPVFFGPNYKKFEEAKDLIRLGGAFEIAGPEALTAKMNAFESNPEAYKQCREIAQVYVRDKQGATNRILHKLSAYLGG